jgi:hypothetical protein
VNYSNDLQSVSSAELQTIDRTDYGLLATANKRRNIFIQWIIHLTVVSGGLEAYLDKTDW